MDGLVTLVGLGFAFGTPLSLWMALLNRRDQRKAGLLGAVMGQLSSRDLRGRIAVQVRSGVLFPRSVVAVDILEASRSEIWEILTRLAQRLSPHVRIEVTGRVDPDFVATATIETARGQTRPHPSRPCQATG